MLSVSRRSAVTEPAPGAADDRGEHPAPRAKALAGSPGLSDA
ncbi:hypothetical protein [Pseudenhygromyxa sp. WMMC2535]|nr:hypothetical protein [Pseudenhygromyxa sp. WMMC2535]